MPSPPDSRASDRHPSPPAHRPSPPARRTQLQVDADGHTVALMQRAGKALKDARLRLRQTQAQASARAGIDQTWWSKLETGKATNATPATWNRAAHAVDAQLNFYLAQTSSATQPRDAVHLRYQELLIRTSAAGGWLPRPEELIDRDARTSRAADVLLIRTHAHQPEYCICEIWDWFDDVGGSLRDFLRRLDALERYAIARMPPTHDAPHPRTSGCWVVRATSRNRQLVHDHQHLFRARFPGSGHAWLTALTRPSSPMPTEPALLWVAGDDPAAARLYPARLG
jgi:transcriptional regulator with XRE-family HTH domain